MLRLCAAICLCALAGVLTEAAPRQQVAPARVYVTVVDPRGKPVENAPVDAFHVWEDGVERRVTGAERATEPLALTIVIHGITSQDTQAARHTISGLLDTFRQANPTARVAVMTAVGTPRLVDITASADSLANDAAHFYESGPGFILFEAVQAACKAMNSEVTDRRVVFAIDNDTTTDGEARSSDAVAGTLEQTNTALWVLDYTPSFASFRGGDLSAPVSINTEKQKLVDAWSVASGGNHDTVMGTTALPDAATRLARLLLSQYAVTYERPAKAHQGKLQVGVAWEPGTKVIAPQWSPR